MKATVLATAIAATYKQMKAGKTIYPESELVLTHADEMYAYMLLSLFPGPHTDDARLEKNLSNYLQNNEPVVSWAKERTLPAVRYILRIVHERE